jgi:hypothetical protein
MCAVPGSDQSTVEAANSGHGLLVVGPGGLSRRQASIPRSAGNRNRQSALPGRSPEQSASAEWEGAPLGRVPVQAPQSA